MNMIEKRNKNANSPTLLYLEEHRGCQNYVSDFTSGFSQQHFATGKEIKFSLKTQFVIIFLRAGEMEITSALNEKKLLSSNHICILNYENEYTCKILENVYFTMLYFDYPKIKCDKYSLIALNEYKVKTPDDIRILPTAEPMKVFVDNLSIYLKNRMMCKHLHDLKESEWLFLMRGFYTKEESAYFLSPVIDSLNDFTIKVKDNYLKCDSVKDLAERCNMSEKTFTRRFKEHFNDTPKQWILREKAKYVKSELDNGKLNVKEIANKFGFSSSAHLNNYYKKQFNTTPGKDKNK